MSSTKKVVIIVISGILVLVLGVALIGNILMRRSTTEEESTFVDDEGTTVIGDFIEEEITSDESKIADQTARNTEESSTSSPPVIVPAEEEPTNWQKVWGETVGIIPTTLTYPAGVTDVYLEFGAVGKEVFLKDEEQLKTFLSDVTVNGIVDSCTNNEIYYIACEATPSPAAMTTLSFFIEGSRMVPIEFMYGNEGSYMGHFPDMYKRLVLRDFNINNFMVYMIKLNDTDPFVVFKDNNGLEYVSFPYGPDLGSNDSTSLYDAEAFVKLLRDGKEKIFNTQEYYIPMG